MQCGGLCITAHERKEERRQPWLHDVALSFIAAEYDGIQQGRILLGSLGEFALVLRGEGAHVCRSERCYRLRSEALLHRLTTARLG